MGLEDSDRLSGLDQQSLVIFQSLQLADDCMKCIPVAGCLAGSAVHHQVLRPLGQHQLQVLDNPPRLRLDARPVTLRRRYSDRSASGR